MNLRALMNNVGLRITSIRRKNKRKSPPKKSWSGSLHPQNTSADNATHQQLQISVTAQHVLHIMMTSITTVITVAI